MVASVQKKIEKDERIKQEEIERKKREEEEELRRIEEEKKRIEEEKLREEEERKRIEEEEKRLEEEEKKLQEEEKKEGEEKKGGFLKGLLTKKKSLSKVTKSPTQKTLPVKKVERRNEKKVVKKRNYFQPPKKVLSNKLSDVIDIQEWTYQSVCKFKDQYFPRKKDESIDIWLATEELKALKNISQELKRVVEESNGIISQKDLSPLEKFSSFLCSGNLSEFELISSGVISTLLYYLTFLPEQNEKNRLDRLDRLRLFSIIFLGLEFPDLQKKLNLPNRSMGVEPLLKLIHVLQDTLTQHELAVFPSSGKNFNRIQSIFNKIPLTFHKDDKETLLPQLENKLANVDILSTTKDLINFVAMQIEEEKRFKEEQEKKNLPVHQKIVNAIKEKTSKFKASTSPTSKSPPNTTTTNSPPKSTSPSKPSLTSKISSLFNKISNKSTEKLVEPQQPEKVEMEDEKNEIEEVQPLEELLQEEQYNEEEEENYRNEEEELQQQEELENSINNGTDDQLERYRRAQNRRTNPRNLLIFYNGHQLNENDVIFKSLRSLEEKNLISNPSFFASSNSVLTYKRIDQHSDINFSSVPQSEEKTENHSSPNKPSILYFFSFFFFLLFFFFYFYFYFFFLIIFKDSVSIENNTTETKMNDTWNKYQTHQLDSVLDQKLESERLDKTVLECISLLSIFQIISSLPASLFDSEDIYLKELVSQDLFENKKLSSLAKEQFADPLSVSTNSYPFWIDYFMKNAPFLFHLSLRTKYFETTSFGMAR